MPWRKCIAFHSVLVLKYGIVVNISDFVADCLSSNSNSVIIFDKSFNFVVSQLLYL